MKFTKNRSNIGKNQHGYHVKKRRAVSEVISSMMLVAITVMGAMMLMFFMDDAFVSGSLDYASISDSSNNIELISYDARDGPSLMLTSINNSHDNLCTIDDETFEYCLCGNSCSEKHPNKIPTNGGSEFIIMQIQNAGIKTAFLENVKINNVNHIWDSNTADELMDTTPKDGMFSIFPIGSGMNQNKDIQIQSGQLVNVIVKLGSGDQDIFIGEIIHVSLDTGNTDIVEFVLESGSVQ